MGCCALTTPPAPPRARRCGRPDAGRDEPQPGAIGTDVGPGDAPARRDLSASMSASSTVMPWPGRRPARCRRPRTAGRRRARSGTPRSCTSRARWFGTPAAACASGLASYATGLTGRSWACAAIGDPQEVRDAPDAADLDDVDRAGIEERPELLEAGEVLARRDRGPDRPPHRGDARRRPSADRLLDPGQVDVALERVTCRTACLRFHDSLASSISAGGAAALPLSRRRVTIPSRRQVALDVEAALELHAGEAAIGERAVAARRARRRRARCPARTRSRGRTGPVPRASRHSGSPAAFAFRSHSAMSSAPIAPNVAPAWPDLKTQRSIRS